jgi:alpha-amylase
VGNFDGVFQYAYEKCYLPFLETIAKHPAVKFSFHTTGPLYHWIEENRPEWFDLLKKLIDSGQAEILGGGFYEPILSTIPEEDRIGQINKMTNYLKSKFDVIPRGMWTAERIWEPTLPSIMAQSGMIFTVLDDTHFRWAGLKDDDLYGYYITEDVGLPVLVFPISKFLRYSIPFKNPQETIDYLKKLYDEKGDIVVVYADDGEKFGVWPGTYNTCYNRRWLARFFHLIAENTGWIKPVFFSEAIQEVASVGRIYLPTSSYAEMGQWSLPADGFSEYEDMENKFKEEKIWDRYSYLIRGGFWRNFMSKYPESNNMHKKMQHITWLIREAAENKTIGKKSLSQAIDLKWQGQCNCPYWHGVFGGLYLNHLRHATYSRFIAAEKILESKKDEKFLEYEIFDFDVDGKEEIILKNRHLNLYIAPFYGGSIFELDYKPSSINLLDTMTRRKEGYHGKLAVAGEADDSGGGSIHDRIEAKEKGLEKYLIYDWHRRVSFLDHFFDKGVTPEQFSANDYNEKGDFVNQPYDGEVNQKDDGELLAIMRRDGHVWINNIWANMVVSKMIILKAGSSAFEVRYRIENKSDSQLISEFGVEAAWSLLAGNSPDRFYHKNGTRLKPSEMDSVGVTAHSDVIGLRDEAFKYDINIKADSEMDWWRFPIETVSLSESGFERNYQQSTVVAVTGLDLKPGEFRDLAFQVSIDKIPD